MIKRSHKVNAGSMGLAMREKDDVKIRKWGYMLSVTNRKITLLE